MKKKNPIHAYKRLLAIIRGDSGDHFEIIDSLNLWSLS